jgi:hypothetical protein
MSTEELFRLVDEAGFIFRGRVVRHGTADTELDSEAADRTLTVEIEEVLNSTDVLRGVAGIEATILSDSASEIADGAVRVFFTECVSLGAHLLAREVGHRDASEESAREIDETLRIAAERPLVERVAGAELVCTGEVVSVKPLERPFPPKSEHDPDWSIARVAVHSMLKGLASRKRIEVLFASSEDIVWYKSPKLHEGDSGIFVLRTRQEDEAPEDVPRTVYQATDPLDFLPHERLPDVERALERYDEGM